MKYGVQLESLLANMSASDRAVEPTKRDEYKNKVDQQCGFCGDKYDPGDLKQALADSGDWLMRCRALTLQQ